MGNFAEVFTNNQAENINKIRAEIGKKLETFNNRLTIYIIKLRAVLGLLQLALTQTKQK